MRPKQRAPRCRAGTSADVAETADRAECLDHLLEAFADIAERDDIHQAALRLKRVLDWINAEADRAAADPIFAALRLAS